MKTMKNILAAGCAATCAILLWVPQAARAERADALKPVNVQYGNISVDNVTQNTIATGNVIITRGTMVLKSDRAEVKESPEGYHTFILTASPGKLATFRQKRDGGPDLWSEGHAQRIEYDERSDVIKLLSNAMIRQLEGQKVTQQMEQAFISYDSRKEVLLGRNEAGGTDTQGKGRGSITFEPTRKPAATTSEAAPAAAAPANTPAAGKQ